MLEFEEAALIPRGDEHHLGEGQLALDVDRVEGARPARTGWLRGVIGRSRRLGERPGVRGGPRVTDRCGMRGRSGREGDQEGGEDAGHLSVSCPATAGTLRPLPSSANRLSGSACESFTYCAKRFAAASGSSRYHRHGGPGCK